MAGLNGTITVASAEYRPCTVKGRRALFHKWEENSDIYAPSPMVGGHAGGVVKYTCAIVEYEDGHVERVKPEARTRNRRFQMFLRPAYSNTDSKGKAILKR